MVNADRHINPFGWEVRTAPALYRDADDLVIFRRAGDGELEVVTSIGPDGVETTRVAEFERMPMLSLPTGIVRLIADQVHPGPTQAERERTVALMGEALAVERGRVDKVIDSHLGVTGGLGFGLEAPR